MTKPSGHYSGWVKRSAVSGRFTAPIGQTTTDKGFKVVKFAKPSRVKEDKLNEALSTPGKYASGARGARP